MVYKGIMWFDRGTALAALTAALVCGWPARAQSTVVGITGSQFTINGHPTYTPAAGFPNADANLAGTLLNVRAVQAIFDDANYPRQGSVTSPYTSNTMGAVAFDYPGAKWDPERQTGEFVKALPEWRRCGVLAFTVNLQGGGPTDGNYGETGPTQPHNNSAFDPAGESSLPMPSGWPKFWPRPTVWEWSRLSDSFTRARMSASTSRPTGGT